MDKSYYRMIVKYGALITCLDMFPIRDFMVRGEHIVGGS